MSDPFPTPDMALTHILVVSDVHASNRWYREVLGAEPQLANTASDSSGYAARPDWRPLTKFEQRGIRLGHGVWDLLFTRRPATPPGPGIITP